MLFFAGSVGCLFHVDATIDVITLLLLESAASDDGGNYTKGEDVFDTPADGEVI